MRLVLCNGGRKPCSRQRPEHTHLQPSWPARQPARLCSRCQAASTDHFRVVHRCIWTRLPCQGKHASPACAGSEVVDCDRETFQGNAELASGRRLEWLGLEKLSAALAFDLREPVPHHVALAAKTISKHRTWRNTAPRPGFGQYAACGHSVQGQLFQPDRWGRGPGDRN